MNEEQLKEYRERQMREAVNIYPQIYGGAIQGGSDVFKEVEDKAFKDGLWKGMLLGALPSLIGYLVTEILR